jgi:hypothetical protein
MTGIKTDLSFCGTSLASLTPWCLLIEQLPNSVWRRPFWKLSYFNLMSSFGCSHVYVSQSFSSTFITFLLSLIIFLFLPPTFGCYCIEFSFEVLCHVPSNVRHIFQQNRWNPFSLMLVSFAFSWPIPGPKYCKFPICWGHDVSSNINLTFYIKFSKHTFRNKQCLFSPEYTVVVGRAASFFLFRKIFCCLFSHSCTKFCLHRQL